MRLGQRRGGAYGRHQGIDWDPFERGGKAGWLAGWLKEMKNVTRMQDKTSGCASSPVIQLRDAGRKYLGGRKKSESKMMIEGKSNAKNYAICYGAMRGRETDRVGSSHSRPKLHHIWSLSPLKASLQSSAETPSRLCLSLSLCELPT